MPPGHCYRNSRDLSVTDDQRRLRFGQRPTTHDQRRCYAITNSPPFAFSRLIECSRAEMAHTAWSSVGGWVVTRCSHRPGAVMIANSDLRRLAAKRMISYATPVITGSNAIRNAKRAQNVVTGKSMYTKMEMIITVMRKLVPQRGWNVGYF